MGPLATTATSVLSRRLRIASLLLATASLAILAGCTTGSRATADSLRLLLPHKQKPTPEQVAAVPYAQMHLQARDVNGVSALGFVDQGKLSWYAGTHAVFYTTANGLLTGTVGFGRNYQTRIIGDSPFDRLAALTSPATVHREFDWLPTYQMGVAVTGTLRRDRIESVEILGRTLELTRFEEQLEGPGLDATNIYWVDPQSGYIWKSRQYLAPGYAVELTQLKPYRPSRN